jgi:hypothetical protein
LAREEDAAEELEPGAALALGRNNDARVECNQTGNEDLVARKETGTSRGLGVWSAGATLHMSWAHLINHTRIRTFDYPFHHYGTSTSLQYTII